MCAANTGSVVPANGIVVRERSVTGRGMTVIAVAAGAVTAERTTTAVSRYVPARRRQQVDVCETAPVESTITGGANKVQLMVLLLGSDTRICYYSVAVWDLCQHKAGGTGQMVCTEGFRIDGRS